jgi:predicted DsbA family dithiol-disulfide isomerase
LHKALSEITSRGDSNRTIELEWQPFQIDPGTAASGEGFEAYNQRRWGSSAWTRQLRGADNDARFSNWKWWPNTKKAHQLVHYLTTITAAKISTTVTTKIDSDKVNQVLFNALYEQGLNISTVDVLLQVTRTAFGDEHVDLDDLRDYLESDRGWSAVQQEIDQGRRTFAIRGVPFFVIRNSDNEVVTTLSGAQPVSTFRSILFDEMN